MVVAIKRYQRRRGANLAPAPLLIRLVVFLHVSQVLLIVFASAQTVQWVGPDGQIGSWSDPANWSLHMPDANSDVLFDVAGQAALVDLAGANDALAGTVTIQNGGVKFFGPGVLNIASDAIIGGANQVPEFEISSQAVVNVLGNLTAFSGEVHVGNVNDAGVLTVTGSLVVGDPAQQSAANLRVENGSSASAGFTELEMGSITIGSNALLSTTQGFNIGAGGALGGNGTVFGSVTNSGLVRPGESIGELSIEGDFVQLAEGKLLIEIQGNLADKLAVSNSVTFGGTLQLVVPVEPAIGQEFTLFTGADQLLGRFDDVIIPPTPGLGMSVTTDGTVRVEGSGDMDQNGIVDREDIDDFVVALINPTLYINNLGIFNSTVGDFAEPFGVLDLFDLPGFEQALRDAGVSASAAALLNVPEPVSWMLATIAIAGLLVMPSTTGQYVNGCRSLSGAPARRIV